MHGFAVVLFFLAMVSMGFAGIFCGFRWAGEIYPHKRTWTPDKAESAAFAFRAIFICACGLWLLGVVA